MVFSVNRVSAPFIPRLSAMSSRTNDPVLHVFSMAYLGSTHSLDPDLNLTGAMNNGSRLLRVSSVIASFLEFRERRSASIELGVVVIKPCGLVTRTRFRHSSLDLSIGLVASIVTRETQPFLSEKLSFGNRLSHGFCYRVSKDWYIYLSLSFGLRVLALRG